MGVSILSLIELLYYVSLRLACNLNYRRNKKIKEERRNSALAEDELPSIKINFSKPNSDKKD
jgi:hypothetical protein